MKNKLGGSIVSNHILDGTGKLKWIFREKSINSIDNGWRFMADNDTQEFIQISENNSIISFEHMIEFEPLISKIFYCEMGSEFEVLYFKNEIVIVDLSNNLKIYSRIKS